jgi:hypothetical protein
MSFNLIEEGLKMQAQSLKNCYCDAYTFPHRRFGGECKGDVEPRPTSLVQYHQTREAMLDAGHKESDF